MTWDAGLLDACGWGHSLAGVLLPVSREWGQSSLNAFLALTLLTVEVTWAAASNSRCPTFLPRRLECEPEQALLHLSCCCQGIQWKQRKREIQPQLGMCTVLCALPTSANNPKSPIRANGRVTDKCQQRWVCTWNHTYTSKKRVGILGTHQFQGLLGKTTKQITILHFTDHLNKKKTQ